MEETTAPYSAGQVATAPELKVRPRVSIAAKTDLGRVRENNEDKFEFYMPEDEPMLASRGLVFVMCDGMGGHAAGQIASELACKTFIDVYLHHPATDVEPALRAGVVAANRFVFDVSQAVRDRQGMGTTMSTLCLVQGEAHIAQVGDSRVYRLREGAVEQLTTDHTWVEEVVTNGTFSRAEAEVHAYRHVLTRAIGTARLVDVDTFKFELEIGDVFLLCTDGLTNHVENEQIGEFMALSPPEAAWKLVSSALVGGGSDNCSVLVVRVDALEEL